MGKPKGLKGVVGLHDFTDIRNVLRILAAEFLGTFLLVFVVCVGATSVSLPFSIPQNAFTAGLVVATLAQTLGHVSGCHINPAVTCGLLVSGHISVFMALLYIVCQCVGALAGAGVVLALVPENAGNDLGVTRISNVTAVQAFFMEALITFLLVLIVHAVCDENRSDIQSAGPVAVGLTVAACNLAVMDYTGSSMNPARSLGPAVATGVWDDHWVYWAGPILGGVVAGPVYTFIFQAKKKEEEAHSYDLPD